MRQRVNCIDGRKFDGEKCEIRKYGVDNWVDDGVVRGVMPRRVVF